MTASRLLTAGVAAALTAFVVRGLGLEPSLEALALVAATGLGIAWSIVGLDRVLRVVSGWRLPTNVSLVLAVGGVSAVVLAARTHFQIFRVPLDAETLRFAWEGLTAREVELPVGLLAAWAAGAWSWLVTMRASLYLPKHQLSAGHSAGHSAGQAGDVARPQVPARA